MTICSHWTAANALCSSTPRLALCCSFLVCARKISLCWVGEKWLRLLYLGALAALNYPEEQLKKVDLALGPVWYVALIDRSVSARCGSKSGTWKPGCIRRRT